MNKYKKWFLCLSLELANIWFWCYLARNLDQNSPYIVACVFDAIIYAIGIAVFFYSIFD